MSIYQVSEIDTLETRRMLRKSSIGERRGRAGMDGRGHNVVYA
jgi:hypothetical protein